jgi:hypothetical protein
MEVHMRNWPVFILLMLVLVSCTADVSKDVSKDIVGYWKGDTLKQDIGFTAEGRVEIVDRKYSTYHGTYTITDENILTCNIEHSIFTRPVVRTVTIKGDKLILKEKGREEVYHRRD